MNRSAATGLAAAMLIWPLLLFQSAGYIWDTSGYYRGGEVAVHYALDKVRPHVPQAANPSATPSKVNATRPSTQKPAPASADGVGGLRSLVYSVAAYLLAFDANVLPLALAQIGLTALLLSILIRTLKPGPSPLVLAVGLAIIAAFSTLPVFVTLATPDLFAGLLILSLSLLIWFDDRLKRADRVTLVLLTALSVTVHASDVALGAVVLPLAVAAVLLRRLKSEWRSNLGRWRWAVSGVVIGLVGNALLGLIGFGEVSVAPKHFPFALARSIEDGPAFWYLQKECPRRSWAVCEVYRDGTMPRGNYEFLWGDNGVAARATPEQMNRIRNEEPMIVRGAVEQYPWFQIEATVTNIGRQIAMVGIDPSSFQKVHLQPDGAAAYRTVQAGPTMPWLVDAQRWLVALSLLGTGMALWRGTAQLRGMAALVILLILANDVICGGISAPDIRYQNRVLWLLPVVALMMAWRWLASRRPWGVPLRQSDLSRGE